MSLVEGKVYSRRRRILYVQFTDPAAYPPIEHSSQILAERGWDVAILGVSAFGVANMKLSSHPRVKVIKLPLNNSGRYVAIQYILFTLSCLFWSCRWRPAWIYASDPIALPAIWVVRVLTRARLVYHEHDSPNVKHGQSRFFRHVLRCRSAIAREADLCILPQEQRLTQFVASTGRQLATVCVWNCPRVSELPDTDCDGPSEPTQELVAYYHGSINRERIPEPLVLAASRLGGAVRIRISGYEAPGSSGYIETLQRLVREKDAEGIVEYLGVIPTHEDLLRIASKAHIGLSLLPILPDDSNLRFMVGASNKAFDYMASGLPLLVTASEDWISTFVRPGYARACDPDKSESIEAQLRWYVNNPEKRRDMSRRCVAKIRESWNYDLMFGTVIKILEADSR